MSTEHSNNDGNTTGVHAGSDSGVKADAPAVATDHSALLPAKFDSGGDFKTWQQKMLFFLSNLNLHKYLKEDKPVVEEGTTDVRTLATVEAWIHSDFICRGWILNGLVDNLYKVYNNDKEYKTSKSLWNALDKKYKSVNQGVQRYATAKFLDFKMVDSEPIMPQVEKFQLICAEVAAEGMKICEPFTINCLIEKLPPSWVDYRNYLKHKQKAITLENLISRLQIEATNRERALTTLLERDDFQAYLADKNKAKGKGKEKNFAKNLNKPSGSKRFKKNVAAKKPPGNRNQGEVRINGNCRSCGKFGHKADDCRSKPKGNRSYANLTEEDLCCVVTEANAIEDNPLEWWYDTGATTHICMDKDLFSTYQPCKDGEKVKMANTGTSKIEGHGKVILKLTSGHEITLTNVKHVPDMRKNLISGTLLSKTGFAVNFESDKLVLRKNGVYLGKGYVKGGLVKMNVMTVKPKKNVTETINKNNSVAYLVESFTIWHERLGHVNYKSVNRLMDQNLIPKFKTSKDKCEICVETKLTKRPSPQVERITEPLGLIHTDLCDLKYMPTRGGKKYFVTFIDDCTKYCHIYLLQNKSEALEKFKEFKLEVENQLEKTIKIVRSDRGGEYEGPFDTFCKENGIIHQTTAPYSPESNGVAERKNRTLKEMMNAIMQESGVTQNLWGEALVASNYILNRIPHKATGKTPYELWNGRVPSYKYLKVWGCLAKVSIPPPKQVTVGPKTVDCIFIGYAHNSSAYRFLVHKSDIPDIHVNTIMESRNASFFENIFPCKEKKNLKRPRENEEEISQHETRELDVSNIASTSGTTPEVASALEPRRSKRARKEKTFGDDFIMAFLLENDPKTYTEAMTTPDAPSWKEAINSEIDSILQNNTWELVDLPEGFKALGNKWIFRTKTLIDGVIDKYKARLVVQGFRQKEGLDFFDTYSPVTRITSIRMLISIAALRDLEIHQMDVKTAFLYGDLEEEIYMKQPEGFVVPGQEDKVCRLVKSLYGLKQAPKQWHEKFDSVMMSNGFRINECDKCIYYKITDHGYILLCLYVDDMLIIGSNNDIVNQTKSILRGQFDMKDMGLADVILGVKIIRHSDGIILSQEHYADKILDRFNKYVTGVARTPIDATNHLRKNKGEQVSQIEYARVIGSLMYLTNCTRPDLAHSVHVLSRYTSNPGHKHWQAVTRVLNYLRFTKNFGLHYGKEPAVLEGYSDANWISDSKNSKSTSGYVFTLGGGAVSWRSTKQTLQARSTMESEFIALDKAAEEAEWLRNFLEDIPMWEKPVPPIRVHCDNQAAIARALNTQFNGKARHIRRRHKTIRRLITTGVITLDYVKSADNLADPFTKGLTKDQVSKSSKGMGLQPTS